MKKKILGTVLLSAVVFSNVGGTTAVLAADPVAKGKGTVKVETGSITPPSPDPDPENKPGHPGDAKDPEDPSGGAVVPDIPGKHNPDYPDKDPGDGFQPGENGGALAIIGASNLRFGTVKTSLSDVLQPASAAKIFVPGTNDYNEDGTIKDNATYTTKSVGNYVQFGDVRTDVDGYQLTAKLETEFIKNGGGTLKGASIIYKNGVLTHADAEEQGIHPTLVKPTMTLEYDESGGAATEVVKLAVTTTSAQKGKGIYSVEYGQSDTFAEANRVDGTVAKGTQGNSVFLKIPATTAGTMAAGDYQAGITWTLTPTIDPDVK